MSDGNEDFMLRRISELEGLVHKATAEAKKYRWAKKNLLKEHEELQAEHARVVKEVAESAATPDEWKSKYEDVLQQVRKRDHRDAWVPVAKPQLVDGVPIEEIWSKIGYSPGEEIPGPESINERLSAAKKAAPYLFKPDGAGLAHSATADPSERGHGVGVPPERARLSVPPGMGFSQGSRQAVPGEFVVTKTQLQTPGFYTNNSKAIQDAQKNNRLVVTDG